MKSIRFWMAVGAAASVLGTLLFYAAPAFAAPDGAASPGLDSTIARWAFVAAAAATSIGTISAAYAVARVGSASIGALTEKPELFGRVLVLVGLAEGIAIYGLIISILILNQLT